MPALPSITLPDPERQPRRLLDQIDRLPVLDVTNPDRWMAGITWLPHPCRTLTVDGDDPCTPEDLSDIDPWTCDQNAWLTQTPFRIGDAFSATTLEFTPADIAAMLANSYDSLVSAAFAWELVTGTGSGDRSLSSVATAPDGLAFGAGAVGIWEALAVLENELGQRLQGRVGYIHLPPGMIGQATGQYGISINTEGEWETAAGNIIISDAGYNKPAPPTGQAAATALQDWIYASGPVFYDSTSPTAVGGGSTVLDMAAATHGFKISRNTFTEYLAGYGILVFDTCPVTAALASYTALMG